MNKLLFWCIKSTYVVSSKFWNYFLCLTNPTICTSNISRITWRALTRYKSTILCIVIIFPCSIVWQRLLFRSIIYVMCLGHLSHDDHVSQSHFSFSQGLVLRSWGCVLLFRCLSLGCLLCHRVIGDHYWSSHWFSNKQHYLSRRVTFVTCRDRESCWLLFCSQKFLFWLENTMYCLCIMMRLFTIDSCGDYRQVWCVSFFSKTSILVVSFGLHQGIQLVDRISMYLAQLAFSSFCREVAQ